MMEAGIRRENRKEYVDEIAAVLILQGFLDMRKNTAQQDSSAALQREEPSETEKQANYKQGEV